MALRIDFFRSEPRPHGDASTSERVELSGEFDSSQLHRLGFISASDLDEQALVDLVEHVDAHIGLFGLAVQGWGLIPAGQIGDVSRAASDVPERTATDIDAATATDADIAAHWSAVLLGAVRRAAAVDAPFAWRTRFDRGGSADDGPDEFETAATLI